MFTPEGSIEETVHVVINNDNVKSLKKNVITELF